MHRDLFLIICDSINISLCTLIKTKWQESLMKAYMYIDENILSAWFICTLIEVLQKKHFWFFGKKNFAIESKTFSYNEILLYSLWKEV